MSADASFAVERFLLQNGASANMQDDFGFGALHFALIKVQLDWQEKYDATHKKTQGQKDREKQILDASKYETEKREAFLRDHLGAIPASESDPVETVSNLAAERGLNLMVQDALGRTPLHLAAATGAFVCVSTLLTALGESKKQASVDTTGMNVLCAFLERFTDKFSVSNPVLFFTMIETLLKRGVDPNPLDYGSYENTRLLAMLVRAGGDLRAKDNSGKTPVDYARAQRSRFVLRFLERTFPDLVMVQPESPEVSTVFAATPKYSDDATAYLAKCESSGKISRSRVVPKVNASCDVGKVSSVHSEGEGAELDALLTKVDVKNGRFGLNVFYRLQLVRDELQDILVLFTNWGRIGETGKFQNTPFRDEEEAVNEFKKIFRSKTGNTWESRAPDEFVKKPKKYNLVQRVNYATKVDEEVTRSFREDMEDGVTRGVVFPDQRDSDLIGAPSIMAMLAAITDVRNLQLAAQTSCGFAGGDLPLAKQDELRAALEK
ncbi:hypothetical protein BBJ29_008540, partial [Phytophthora kernoviae]